MRPIFSPSVRVKVACPSRVGCGTLAGRTKSGFSSDADAFRDLDLEFFALGRALRGLGKEFTFEFEASIVPVAAFFALEADVCSARTGSSLGLFAEAVCACRALSFAFSFFAGISAGFSLRRVLAVRTG